MPEKVPHKTLKFAYRCTEPGCDRPPFRWRDQAEDCERSHELRRKWAAERGTGRQAQR